MRNNKSFASTLACSFIMVTSIILLSSWNPGVLGQNPDHAQLQMAEKSSVEVASPPFFVYKNGEFKEAVLTKEPEMIGGKEMMETLIKLNIRYPEMAKEKKIGGTVYISVVIDSLGNMEDAFVHEGIGGGCNDEALRAVKLMNKMGFEPGEINGKPVTVKFDIPLTFLPQ